MSRAYLLLLILILLTSGLFAIPKIVPSAHSALVGKVCISKDGSTSCPFAPPLINTTGTIPQTLRLAVVINASSSLSTFDITLLTNSSILKPANAVAAGSIINGTGAAITVLSKCIGGTGSGCAPTDTKDSLHYTISSSQTAQGPATGLLFTATYTVVGASQFSTNSPIGFQTGCSSSSVGNGICITILSGSTTPVPETSQIAKFTNQAYFDLQTAASVPSLTVPVGSSDTTLLLNVTSINGFGGTVTLASSVSPPGPTVKLSQTTVKVNSTFPSTTGFFCCQINVTVTTSVTPNNYTITFTGSSGTLPTNTLTLPVIVPKPDFAITGNPTTLTFNVSRTRVNSTITLKSLYNFVGKVNLTLSATQGIQASILKTRFNVTRGGSNMTTLSLTPTQGGFFDVNITATSAQLTPHQITIKVIVLDFVMYVQPGALVLPQGSSAQEVVNFGSAFTIPYNVTVTISKIYVAQVIRGVGLQGPSTGISVVCTPFKINLTNSGTGEITSLSNCNVDGIQAGNYTVTVVGVSGTVSHATIFAVQVLGPDFNIVPSPTIETLSVGTSGTISLALAKQLGFNSNVTLSYLFPGQTSTPSVSISVPQVPLNSTFPTATAIVTVTSGANEPTGIYTLQLTGFSKTYQITHVVTVTIVVSTTTSPHDIAVYSVTANPASTTTGSSVQISIIVQNLGKVNETASVVALVGDLSVGQTNITIAPGTNMTVILTWNTNGYGPGAYTVGGKVLAVPGEIVTNNNILRAPTTVTLTAANTSILESPYFQTAIIVGLIAVIAIVTILLLQTRRRTTGPGDSSPKTGST